MTLVLERVEDWRHKAARRKHRQPAPSKNFRADIQGLRAVAVVLVALGHAGIAHLGGGFIGVDVFYVVSGFVITGSLLGGRHRYGNSITGFYAARARRILPMATTVLVVTVIAAWKLLDVARAQRVVTDAMWAGFFGANFRFSSQGTDYFASTLPQSPLQHYWSLAVEEQFYLVWPVILAALTFGFTMASQRRSIASPIHRVRVLVVLGAIILVSLGWSIKQTGSNQIVAFFSTFTRAWELAIGAALAVSLPYVKRVPAAGRAALSWAGLIGVALAATVITSTTPYPGSAALLPVLSTAAIIAGGTGGIGAGAGVLLRTKPFQAAGNWSFSFYLWHWPILILAEARASHPLSIEAKLVLLLIALVLSFMTYRVVETPFRTSDRLEDSKTDSLALWPIALAALALTCFVAHSSLGLQQDAAVAAFANAHPQAVPNGAVTAPPVALTSKQLTQQVIASVATAKDNGPLPANLTPFPYNALKDWLYPTQCMSMPGSTTNKLCKYGDPAVKRTLVLAGDSHALQWLPALDAIGKEKGWTVIPLIKIYCVSADMKAGKDASSYAECSAWQKWMFSEVRQIHPERVVIANYQQGAHFDQWQSGIASTTQKVKADGAAVTVLSDPPGVIKDPGVCLLTKNATMSTCTVTETAAQMQMNRAVQTGTESQGGTFVDLTSWFCSNGVCPSVIGTTVAFKDFQHISRTYSLESATALGARLGL